MTGSLLLTMAGIAVLYAGAELLVRGSLALSVRLRISSLLTGVLVVGLGTSSPELIVSLQASLLGSGEMAVGNIIGSNISNMALILGLAALIRPVHCQPGLVRREFPLLAVVSAVLSVLLVNGSLTRLDGALMLAGLVVWIGWILRSDQLPTMFSETQSGPGIKADASDPENVAIRGSALEPDSAETRGAASEPDSAETRDAASEPDSAETRGTATQETEHKSAHPIALSGRLCAQPLILLWGLTLTGLALLLLASNWIIHGAAELARFYGLSEGIIGLSLVAVGTSLPELATVIVAGLKRENGLIMGTLLGSNMLNLLFVLGVTGLAGSILLDSIVTGDLVLMTLLVILPWPVAARGQVGRVAGLTLLAIYAGWMVWLLVR